MVYRYGREDVKFVASKIKAGIKLKDINDLYHFWRTAESTETKKGDYTNFISKVSPGSKHREKTVTTAYEHTCKYSVIQNIMRCMGCGNKAATKIYKERVVPVCVARFHDPSNANMVSIRYHPASCNDYLYFIFTSEDYAETFGLDPELHTDDVWTVRTQHELIDILRGELTREMIESELTDMINRKDDIVYTGTLLNVCVVK